MGRGVLPLPWAMVHSLEPARVPALADIPGVEHGFSRRHGTNGGESRDDTRRRVRADLASRGRLLLLHQVHGTAVRRAPWTGTPEADGGFAEEPGWLLGIETADCLPVLLVDPVRRVVAAAHAGWRGTAGGIARVALQALVGVGSRVEDVVAALGPAIGPCCYEVGEDVRQAFGAEGASFFRPGPRERPHLDVRAANRAQLLAGGLAEAHLHSVDECTRCRGDLYFSYRRDGAGAGRMISWVGLVR